MSKFITRNQVEPGLVAHYGTSRWLAGNTKPPAPDGGAVRVGPHVAQIEYLSGDTAASFEGLRLEKGHDLQVREQIQAAGDLLAHVPSLADSVGAVVWSIHPLRALRDHDVSHSTPELPFSIFISVPRKGERDATLRVAESLIHEAMHLQLTLIDSIEPLATDDRASGFSPWKGERRPVTGLLHGLYVFAVIHQVLELLIGEREDWGPYSRKRLDVIACEIALLPETPGGLSKTGTALWRACRNSINA